MDTAVSIDADRVHEVLKPLKEGAMRSKEILSKPDSEGRQHYFATCFFPEPKQWMSMLLGELKEAFDTTVFYLRTGYEQLPLKVYSS